MTRKKLLLVTAIAFFAIGFSQEKLVDFKNDLDDSNYSIKEVIPAVNQKNNDISLFFMNSKQVHGYLFNDNFDLTNKLSLEDKRRKYNTVIGYSVTADLNYNLFLTNDKKNKFAAINFSYGGENSVLNEFKFLDYKEKFVQTATINNNFYLITITSETSKLNIYKFDGIELPKPHTLTFGLNEFLGRDGRHEKLYNLFKIKSNGSYIGVETNKVDKYIPNSIEVVSKEKKLYVIDNKLVFTFDNNREYTQILTINLKDYSSDIRRVEKPLFDVETRLKKSNSYINDSMLFTISSTNDDLEVMIQDFSSAEKLKDIKLNVEDSISFKNTPIIQEGGVYDGYRELESTKKFLRKITSGDLGISAYKEQDEYLITIGSEKEVARGGGMMMPMGGFGGFPIASVGGANIFFNPTYFAYNSYSSTKSTRIECLFDANFNHIDADIKENIFDRMHNLNETKKDEESQSSDKSQGYTRLKGETSSDKLKEAETIFRYKHFYILGDYLKKEKVYTLRKFEN